MEKLPRPTTYFWTMKNPQCYIPISFRAGWPGGYYRDRFVWSNWQFNIKSSS